MLSSTLHSATRHARRFFVACNSRLWCHTESSTTRDVLPYGKDDFRRIRDQEQFYVDKTQFIRELERTGMLSNRLHRPSGFGKSLFANTLAAYYDTCATDEEFERWFGNLDIGCNPTKQARKYHVLNFDFSMYPFSVDESEIQNLFRATVNETIQNRAQIYGLHVELDAEDCSRSLERFIRAANDSGNLVYTIVDDYDCFERKLMFQVLQYKNALGLIGKVDLHSEISGFFSTLKNLEKYGNPLFTTGIAPRAPEYVLRSSSTNANLSVCPNFAGVCGFTDSEMKKGLVLISGLSESQATYVEELMREMCGGYRFHMKAQSLYNPSYVVGFLSDLHRSGSVVLDKLEGTNKTEKVKWIVNASACESGNLIQSVNSVPTGRDTILQLASGESFLANLDDAMESFRPEYLSSSARVIHYLFQYGILTMDDWVHSNRNKFNEFALLAQKEFLRGDPLLNRVEKVNEKFEGFVDLVLPNLMIEEQLLGHTSVGVTGDEFMESLLEPTSSKWQAILQKCMDRCFSADDLCRKWGPKFNRFDRFKLVVGLMSTLVYQTGRVVEVIPKQGPGLDKKGKVRLCCQVFLVDRETDNGVLLNLEQLSPADTVFKSDTGDTNEIVEELKSMTNEQLEHIQYKSSTDTDTTVRGVIEELQGFAEQSCQDVMVKYNVKRLKTYAAVTVGNRVLVKDTGFYVRQSESLNSSTAAQDFRVPEELVDKIEAKNQVVGISSKS